MLPPDLPPALPIAAPASSVPIALPFVLADKGQPKDKAEAKMSKEQVAFNAKVKIFEDSLKKLPDNHKVEVSRMHDEVDAWADKERASGKKADKLSTFVGKVMTYLHQRLLTIEENDPQLKRLKEEHRQLQKLFLQGDDVINAYLAWVKNKNDPIDKPEKG